MAKIAFAHKRIAAFTADPKDIVVITDKNHPLYDSRVELPIDPEFLASINRRGVIKAVIVRKIDGKPVVVDGRRRVLTARVANIQRKKDGLPIIMVPFTERKGDTADAFGVTVEANEHRLDDPLRTKIEKAQRLAQLGHDPESIASMFKGVSVATVKRWLNSDPTKRTGARKKRAKAVPRPGRKEIAALVEQIRVHATPRELALLDWIQGVDQSGKNIAEHFLGTAPNGVRPEARPT